MKFDSVCLSDTFFEDLESGGHAPGYEFGMPLRASCEGVLGELGVFGFFGREARAEDAESAERIFLAEGWANGTNWANGR